MGVGHSMPKLTLNALVSKFQKLNPYGTISKQSNSKYEVSYDTRDTRTEAEKELDFWSVTADKRKIYTYNATNLIQLAYKLNIDISEYEETKLSKVNQEWEEWLKREEPEVNLFGE
jgi:hypothetical protein